jgi:hypothetical protein
MNVPLFVNVNTVLVLCHTVDIICLENFTMLLTAICSPGAAVHVICFIHCGFPCTQSRQHLDDYLVANNRPTHRKILLKQMR